MTFCYLITGDVTHLAVANPIFPILAYIPSAWRIIPVSKWLMTMVSCKASKDRVVGPLPNGQTSWFIDGGG